MRWRGDGSRDDARRGQALPRRLASAVEDRAFAPVDIASLVAFRIAFGALLTWEIYRYFDHGWIGRYFVEPTFFFKYPGFEWVHPWSAPWIHVHCVAMGALSALLLVGLWYRQAAALFCVSFSFLFLLDETNYLNHFYLIVLLSFLMIFLPAHRAFSIDAWRHPWIRSSTVPAWTIWLLRAQIGIVYFFGGVAKLNRDWLRGEPMGAWLVESVDFPDLGPLFVEGWGGILFAYGGLVLDLAAPFLLSWRPTRAVGFALVVLFHLANERLFRIGIFPWFMIAATTVFFPPDWPRTLLRRPPLPAAPHREARTSRSRRLGIALVAVYLVVQVLVPLRHFLYPGNVSWTEEGHCFSWHMMLRDKEGAAKFRVTTPGPGGS
ncbi:MAG: HTTM domain-containing protein [bacterium]